MSAFRIGVALLLILLFLGACVASLDDGSDHEVQADTVDGLVRIQNKGTGLWSEADRWSVELEWIIGSASGGWETTLGGGWQNARIAPDGNIYYFSSVDRQIRVFNGDGSYVRAFGGEGAGEGPGEISTALSMAWDDQGRLWVPDFSLDRYTLFGPDGSYLEDFRRPIGAAAGLSHIGAFDRHGHFVDEAAVSALESSRGVGGVQLIRVAVGGRVVDTLPPMLRPGYVPPDVGAQIFLSQTSVSDLNVYRPALLHDFGPDDTVWFAAGTPLRLIQRTFEGDTVRIVAVDHRSRKLTEADEAWIAEFFSDISLDRSDFNLMRRAYLSLHVLDDGHLLLEVEEEPREGTGEYDVFNPQGFFLGTLDLGVSLDIRARPGSRGDTLVIPTQNEQGIPQLVRLVLHRP